MGFGDIYGSETYGSVTTCSTAECCWEERVFRGSARYDCRTKRLSGEMYIELKQHCSNACDCDEHPPIDEGYEDMTTSDDSQSVDYDFDFTILCKIRDDCDEPRCVRQEVFGPIIFDVPIGPRPRTGAGWPDSLSDLLKNHDNNWWRRHTEEGAGRPWPDAPTGVGGGGWKPGDNPGNTGECCPPNIEENRRGGAACR